MSALQSSDRARFKDASEAEQGLREAWDRCLTQGLVHPAVLAMEEMPHDKVPARMHEPRGGAGGGVPRAPVPIHASDSNEMTAIDDKMLGRPIAIESSKPARVGDDDPTMLSVRDGARSERPSGKARAIEPAPSYPDGSGPRRVDEALRTEKDPSMIQSASADRGISGERLHSVLPRIVVGVLVLVAVIAAALVFSGVIR
jgi:hypothetical protein